MQELSERTGSIQHSPATYCNQGIEIQTKVIYLLPSLDLSENRLSLQTFLREDRHGVRTVSSYHHKHAPPTLVVEYVSSKTLHGFRDGDSYNIYCSNTASCVHLMLSFCHLV